MRWFAALTSLALICSGAHASEEAKDLCRDVLVYAAHNINQSFRSSEMASDVKSALCNTEESVESSKKSGGGNLIVFGAFGLSGKGGNEKIKQMNKKYCTSSDSTFSKSELEEVLSELVDKDSVQAWKNCIDRKGEGLVGSVERDDDVVIFRLRWNAGFGVAKTTVDSFQLSGAICEKKWEQGTIIDSVQRTLMCSGTPSKSVRLVIQTQNASIDLKSPVVPKIDKLTEVALKKPSLAQKCYNGDKASCIEASQTQKSICGNSRICGQKAICFDDVAATIDVETKVCSLDRDSQDCLSARKCRVRRATACKNPPPLAVMPAQAPPKELPPLPPLPMPRNDYDCPEIDIAR